MKILFLCVANSARSQMAEGLARFLYRNDIEIVSAGSEPKNVNPFSLEAMSNVGIDISRHYSKAINEVLKEDVSLVVTLCADEVCPIVPIDVKKEHWPFNDPASELGTKEQILNNFEKIRDQIKEKLIEFGKKENLLKVE